MGERPVRTSPAASEVTQEGCPATGLHVDSRPGIYAGKYYASDWISGNIQAIFLYCREFFSSPSSSEPYSGLTSQPHPSLNDLTVTTEKYQRLTRMKKLSVRKITRGQSSRTSTIFTGQRTSISETYPDQGVQQQALFSHTWQPQLLCYKLIRHSTVKRGLLLLHTTLALAPAVYCREWSSSQVTRTAMGEPSRIAHRYAIHVLKLFIPLNAVGYRRPRAPLAYTSIP